MLKGIFRWLYSWVDFFRRNLAQNPILSRELIRYLRQTRSFVLLGCILLGGAVLLIWMWSTPSNNLSPVGRRLFYATVGGEILVLLLLLPGYAAQSFITERERNTLALLLTTPLGEERIAAGKLASVLGVIALILFATYPLIAVCLARGGVAPWEVLLAGVGALTGAFIISSFALYFSLIAKTLFRAVMLTQMSLLTIYIGGMFFTFMLLSAVVLVLSLISMAVPGIQATFAVIAVVAAVCIIIPFTLLIPLGMFKLTASKLRSIGGDLANSKGYDQEVAFQFGQDVVSEPIGTPRSKWNVPDNANAFYWREKMSNAVSSPFLAMPSWYIVAILVYHLCLVTPIQNGCWLAIATLCLLSQMGGAYAARSFAGEKESETWDLLITTTCRNGDLLKGKLLGALQPCLTRGAAMFWIPAALFAFIDLCISLFSYSNMPGIGVPVSHQLVYATVITVNVCLVCALGLFFSSIKRSVNQALLWTYGTIAAYYFGPLFFYAIIHGSAQNLFITYISPLAVLGRVGSTKGIPPEEAYTLPVTILFEPIQILPLVAIHVVVTALIAIALLKKTQWQLNQNR
ncbi:MAG: ABC transporter permease subunit [Candidatus Hinthialibacter antarcticus]|nr:ABC transporter permease subunit [Candidatus Hinthialibacter antarcticus]